MTLDETDKALIESAEELTKKAIPDNPKGLRAAYKEALDLRKQLEDKRQPVQEKINKLLEILPEHKRYFDLEFSREGVTSEERAEIDELWSNFTPADRQRVTQINELARTNGEWSGARSRLDRWRLRPIRLKAVDKDIVLEEFVVHKEDYTSFTCDGNPYLVGLPQGKAIKLLHKEGMAGRPDVPIEDIKRVMGLPQASDLRDSFRRKGLWNALLVTKKRKTCRLSIFS